MSLFALLLMALVPVSGTGRSSVAVCPAVSPTHTAHVQAFFSSEATRPLREEYGLLGIGPGDVRALTDAQDAEACRRLEGTGTLPQTQPYPKVWRGFRAGAYYVMLITLEVPEGVLYHGDGTGIIVFDPDMNVVMAAS